MTILKINTVYANLLWGLLANQEILTPSFLNMCPFDYTAFVVSGKVGYP